MYLPPKDFQFTVTVTKHNFAFFKKYFSDRGIDSAAAAKATNELIAAAANKQMTGELTRAPGAAIAAINKVQGYLDEQMTAHESVNVLTLNSESLGVLKAKRQAAIELKNMIAEVAPAVAKDEEKKKEFEEKREAERAMYAS